MHEIFPKFLFASLHPRLPLTKILNSFHYVRPENTKTTFIEIVAIFETCSVSFISNRISITFHFLFWFLLIQQYQFPNLAKSYSVVVNDQTSIEYSYEKGISSNIFPNIYPNYLFTIHRTNQLITLTRKIHPIISTISNLIQKQSNLNSYHIY